MTGIDRQQPGSGGPDGGAGQRGRRFVPLAKVLARYLEESGLGESLARLGALDEWADVVGHRIGRVTRAVEVRGDVLVVEVLSSAWITELTMMEGLILNRVNDRRAGPAIGRLRFRLAESANALGPVGEGQRKPWSGGPKPRAGFSSVRHRKGRTNRDDFSGRVHGST